MCILLCTVLSIFKRAMKVFLPYLCATRVPIAPIVIDILSFVSAMIYFLGK